MAYDSLLLLQPRARTAFERFQSDLQQLYVRGEIPTLFRVFETFRGPDRQLQVYKSGNSRALPWQSPHNYGLAVDVVPYDATRKWYWDCPIEHWAYVASTARRHGLDAPISWDRGHVEHPLWNELKQHVL